MNMMPPPGPPPAQRYTSPIDKRLFAAVRAKDLPLVEQLLNDGASANANSNGDFRVLHVAVFDGAGPEIVKLLLARRAHVDAKTEKGVTALDFAIGRQDLVITKLLVEAGADVHGSKLKDGRTPLFHALDYKSGDDVAIYLLSKGVSMYNTTNRRLPFTQALTWKHYAAASEMLARGFPVDCRDGEEKTALMRAVEGENIEAVRFLIGVNANPNLVHKTGGTPLKMALQSKEKHRELITELLKGGAEIDLPENDAVRRIRDKDAVRDLFNNAAALRREYLESRFNALTEGSDAAIVVKKPLRIRKALT